MDPSLSTPSHDSISKWPIALRKGIQSTGNPYLVYIRLSPSYSLLFSLYLVLLFLKMSMRHLIILKYDMLWMKCGLLQTMTHGGLFLFPLEEDSWLSWSSVSIQRVCLNLWTWLLWPRLSFTIGHFTTNTTNVFLCGDIKKEIYMRQPPRVVAQRV